MDNVDSYIERFRGGFTGILRWPQLDKLWKTLLQDPNGGWYIYAVGESPPETPADARQLEQFLKEINSLLRREHKEDYCGIVYADNRTNPEFIKIYDPNNLGVVCGSSAHPPLPGWTLSKTKPMSLTEAFPPVVRGKSWLSRLFQ